MCLSKIYSKAHVGMLLSDKFPVQIDPKKGDALSPLFFILL
jgi:hypothetical protein